MSVVSKHDTLLVVSVAVILGMGFIFYGVQSDSLTGKFYENVEDSGRSFEDFDEEFEPEEQQTDEDFSRMREIMQQERERREEEMKERMEEERKNFDSGMPGSEEGDESSRWWMFWKGNEAGRTDMADQFSMNQDYMKENMEMMKEMLSAMRDLTAELKRFNENFENSLN